MGSYRRDPRFGYRCVWRRCRCWCVPVGDGVKRKKWKLTYRGLANAADAFPSQRKTYQFVQDLGRSYAINPEGMARYVTVWVDEGRGWQKFDVLDLEELKP